MQHFDRAARRQQRARVVAKRYRENLRFNHGPVDQDWVITNARARARTAKPCSCHLCCNVRRKYGNAQAALTLQERAAITNMRDDT